MTQKRSVFPPLVSEVRQRLLFIVKHDNLGVIELAYSLAKQPAYLKKFKRSKTPEQAAIRAARTALATVLVDANHEFLPGTRVAIETVVAKRWPKYQELYEKESAPPGARSPVPTEIPVDTSAPVISADGMQIVRVGDHYEGLTAGLTWDIRDLTSQAVEESRVTLTQLAEKLGYVDKARLKELAHRHAQEISEFGDTPTVVVPVKAGFTTRQVEELTFNPDQAAYLALSSETPQGRAYRVRIVKGIKALAKLVEQHLSPMAGLVTTVQIFREELQLLKDEFAEERRLRREDAQAQRDYNQRQSNQWLTLQITFKQWREDDKKWQAQIVRYMDARLAKAGSTRQEQSSFATFDELDDLEAEDAVGVPDPISTLEKLNQYNREMTKAYFNSAGFHQPPKHEDYRRCWKRIYDWLAESKFQIDGRAAAKRLGKSYLSWLNSNGYIPQLEEVIREKEKTLGYRIRYDDC